MRRRSRRPRPPTRPPPRRRSRQAPEPPPPPPKPAKEKFVGKFTQAFDGDVKDAADAAAKKAAGKADKDGKKYNAAMEKAQKAFTDAGSSVENTDKQISWSMKGKVVHTISYEASGTDANSFTVKLLKDGKTDLKGKEVTITFKDDGTFEMMDPFAKKDPKKLIFKK
jgi:plastocyanin